MNHLGSTYSTKQFENQVDSMRTFLHSQKKRDDEICIAGTDIFTKPLKQGSGQL